jgi:hypothetical protein
MMITNPDGQRHLDEPAASSGSESSLMIVLCQQRGASSVQHPLGHQRETGMELVGNEKLD